jgi:KDO2-lipid IV(A) lauroyltransferase
MNYPIVYVWVKKIKRGYYTLSADILQVPPYTSLQEGHITEAHTRRLEGDIAKQPATWLWTHRRWKHKRSAVH